MVNIEKVIENKPVYPPLSGIYKLVLRGRTAETARPGQFVHLQIGETMDPLFTKAYKYCRDKQTTGGNHSLLSACRKRNRSAGGGKGK